MPKMGSCLRVRSTSETNGDAAHAYEQDSRAKEIHADPRWKVQQDCREWRHVWTRDAIVERTVGRVPFFG